VNLDYISFDLDDSQVGDVVVSIVHNGFYRQTTIWINVDNEDKGQKTPREILIKHYVTFSTHSPKCIVGIYKQGDFVPCVDDI
jgi:hypothetical protein